MACYDCGVENCGECWPDPYICPDCIHDPVDVWSSLAGVLYNKPTLLVTGDERQATKLKVIEFLTAQPGARQPPEEGPTYDPIKDIYTFPDGTLMAGECYRGFKDHL